MSRDTSEAPPQMVDEPSRPALPRMTFEEYLALDDERTMSEWVDGEVIFMSPTTSGVDVLLCSNLGLVRRDA